MLTQFALDLRLARKTAGLTQDDCATLMNRSRKHIYRLEKGSQNPSLEDILCLTVIYNKTFEHHFAERLSAARATVRAGLPQLPTTIVDHAEFRQRKYTLERIEAELINEDQDYEG